jgi:hypothetical protein
VSEVLQGPSQDNRPEVQVTSLVYTFRTGPDNGNPENYEQRVKYEAVCRFGCGSYLTPDVVQVVNYVNNHLDSESHYLARYDWLNRE